MTDHHVNLMDGEGNRLSIFTVPERERPTVDLVRLEALIASHDLIVLNIIPYTKQLIPRSRNTMRKSGPTCTTTFPTTPTTTSSSRPPTSSSSPPTRRPTICA
ncbi:MAG: hypothetical protein M0C28_18895 [Candidatus Moduliflexus flocculans]|nr:hypothetical protein [Candidatus Moduliflexus flocculans]